MANVYKTGFSAIALPVALTTAMTILAACSAHPEPIIDTRGVNMDQYAIDLEECEALANPVKVTEGAAKGAAGGAVIGAAVGAISGDAGPGAGYGAIFGATRHGQEADMVKRQVVRRCLAGRGYQVLN